MNGGYKSREYILICRSANGDLGKSVEARYYEILGKSFEFSQRWLKGDYIIKLQKNIEAKWKY
ncbi:MAG: hypothetical protein CM15mP106_5250 [Candidatus Neomarinimicrobiota bacterium]|nr:MAG: hypothetical protein CM15mP106_5250 [Candidatus Neomarinimicrobiota bacterium]